MEWLALGAAILIGGIVGVIWMAMRSSRKLGRQEVINEIHRDAEERDEQSDDIRRSAIPTGRRLLDSIRGRNNRM